MIAFWEKQHDKLIAALLQHLELVAVTLFFSLLIASVLTLAAVYNRKLGEVLIQVFSVLYSVPSMALFALLIPVTGLGTTTAVIVLTGYNQYLLLRNFIEGLLGVDSAVVEAAQGLGMSRMQILVKIRLPLAQSALFTGIQLAVISTISIATIAAMVNAGGLGTILFDGLRTLNVYKIVWGSLLCAGLALCMNGIFALAQAYSVRRIWNKGSQHKA